MQSSCLRQEIGSLYNFYIHKRFNAQHVLNDDLLVAIKRLPGTHVVQARNRNRI